MPKSYTSRRATYVPRRRGRPTTTQKKPYGGSRYGNDAFIKVEAIQPLANAVGLNVFSTMRVTVPQAVAPGNTYLGDQSEFLAFKDLYARYEVVGMKAEVTLNAVRPFAAANLAGGFTPRMPSVALFPTEANNVAFPVQKDCNVQGEMTSLYYAYSKDLKNSGSQFATSTTAAYNDQEQGAIQFRAVLGAATPINTVVGSIKFTWYVRFHGRTRTALGQRLVPLVPSLASAPLTDPDQENKDPQSEMSYADLQQQVATMMGNRKNTF